MSTNFIMRTPRMIPFHSDASQSIHAQPVHTDGSVRAAAAGRWLWVLRAATRSSGGGGWTKYLELQKCFRKRFQKAEMGLWEELLQEHTHELANTQVSGEGVSGSDLPQAREDVDAMKIWSRECAV